VLFCRQNTAMHYACLGGHVEAVQLLLDRKGDVTLMNTYDHSPLDLAIDNLHHDVAITMLRNKRLHDRFVVHCIGYLCCVVAQR